MKTATGYGLLALGVGIPILIPCAYVLSKMDVKDRKGNKFNGLVAGIVIGGLLCFIGLIMLAKGMFFSKNSSVVPLQNSGNKKPANNPITAAANQLETAGAVEAANAQKKLEAAQELNKVAGLIKA